MTTFEELDLPTPQPRVERHKPDWEDPGEPVRQRLLALAPPLPTCIFLNPIATVTCRARTRDFFREVRKIQAEWCKQSRTLFPRSVRRSVKDWVGADGAMPRNARYWDRACSLTGVLLIHGEHVPPHKWPDRKTRPKDPPLLRNPVNESNHTNYTNHTVPGEGVHAGHRSNATDQPKPIDPVNH